MITNGRSQIQTTPLLSQVQKEVYSFKNKPDDKIFIHIARYHPVKNQQLLFNVFNSLYDYQKDFQLIIIGSGFEKCNFIPQKPYIHILGERNNIGDYLYCSDYFVLTSLIEGLPLSLLEAMSMGVIPITTPAGGIKDVIHNKKNGFISLSFTEKDFLKTIKEAMAYSYLIKKSDIKKEYTEKYSMESCSLKYQKIYQNSKY